VSNVGVKTLAEWKIGDATGQFSARQPVSATQGEQLDEAFGLATGTIKKRAWAYPDPNWLHANVSTYEERFKKSGGYVFWDENDHVVAVKGAAPSKPPEYQYKMFFGSPTIRNQSICSYWRPLSHPESFPGMEKYCFAAEGGYAYTLYNSTDVFLYKEVDEQVENKSGIPEHFPDLYLVNCDFNVKERLIAKKTTSWEAGDVSGVFSKTRAVSSAVFDNEFKLPEGTIKKLAWAYPDGSFTNRIGTARDRFKAMGGYVFFDEDDEVVAVKTLTLDKPKDYLAHYQLDFGQRSPAAEDCDFWQDITWETPLIGAQKFCWSSAGIGSFNYMTENETFGFPVVESIGKQTDLPLGLGPYYLYEAGFLLSHDLRSGLSIVGTSLVLRISVVLVVALFL